MRIANVITVCRLALCLPRLLGVLWGAGFTSISARPAESGTVPGLACAASADRHVAGKPPGLSPARQGRPLPRQLEQARATRAFRSVGTQGPAGVHDERATAQPPGSFWGRIVVATGGRKCVIPVGEARSGTGRSGARGVSGRTSLRRVRPLWERADGSPIAKDPAYRGRKFTRSGSLIGRPVDITLRLELSAELPRSVRGLRVRLEIDDLAVTAHRYRTSRGRVRSVDERPVEVGHLPRRVLTLSTGRVSGPRLIGLEMKGVYERRPGRADVVRLAGYGFGVKCRYRIAVEGFGERRPLAARARTASRGREVRLAAARPGTTAAVQYHVARAASPRIRSGSVTPHDVGSRSARCGTHVAGVASGNRGRGSVTR